MIIEGWRAAVHCAHRHAGRDSGARCPRPGSGSSSRRCIILDFDDRAASCASAASSTTSTRSVRPASSRRRGHEPLELGGDVGPGGLIRDLGRCRRPRATPGGLAKHAHPRARPNDVNVSPVTTRRSRSFASIRCPSCSARCRSSSGTASSAATHSSPFGSCAAAPRRWSAWYMRRAGVARGRQGPLASRVLAGVEDRAERQHRAASEAGPRARREDAVGQVASDRLTLRSARAEDDRDVDRPRARRTRRDAACGCCAPSHAECRPRAARPTPRRTRVRRTTAMASAPV